MSLPVLEKSTTPSSERTHHKHNDSDFNDATDWFLDDDSTIDFSSKIQKITSPVNSLRNSVNNDTALSASKSNTLHGPIRATHTYKTSKQYDTLTKSQNMELSQLQDQIQKTHKRNITLSSSNSDNEDWDAFNENDITVSTSQNNIRGLPHRSHSIDHNAQQLGINTRKLDRLTAPLLYGEIHTLLNNLYNKYKIAIYTLFNDPLEHYQTQLDGLYNNSGASKTASLKVDFASNMTLLANEMRAIQHAVTALKHTNSLTVPEQAPNNIIERTNNVPQLPSLPSLNIISTTTSLPTSPVSASSNDENIPSVCNAPVSPNRHQRVTSKYAQQPYYHPMYTNITAFTPTHNDTLLCKVLSHSPSQCSFLLHRLNKLCYMQQVMLTLSNGFDPAQRNDSRTCYTALPTTNSNLEGLRVLNIALQAIDYIYDVTGCSKQVSARMSLQFQRLGNTLLDNFQLHDHRWANT